MSRFERYFRFCGFNQTIDRESFGINHYLIRKTKNAATPKKGLQRCFLASLTRFERVAFRLGGERSILLSYRDNLKNILPAQYPSIYIPTNNIYIIALLHLKSNSRLFQNESEFFVRFKKHFIVNLAGRVLLTVKVNPVDICLFAF